MTELTEVLQECLMSGCYRTWATVKRLEARGLVRVTGDRMFELTDAGIRERQAIEAADAERVECEFDDPENPFRLTRYDRWQTRWPCQKCGAAYPTDAGHDPCIANLPSVRNACCGHGVRIGYVQFTNGVVLRGVFDTSS